MILGLLGDGGYRKDANESQEELSYEEVTEDPDAFSQGAKNEVSFCKALWERNFSRASDIARQAADAAVEDQLAGYRAWWYFLGASAARARGDADQEIDCLRRARATGINAGFLEAVLKKHAVETATDLGDSSDVQAEAIWNRIDELGWHGPTFSRALEEMRTGIVATDSPTQFHMALEQFGQFLGASALRSTATGAPDVVWVFPGQAFTFEAKTEKRENSIVAKRDVLQALGHPKWLKANRVDLKNSNIVAVLITPGSRIDEAAKPHLEDLINVTPSALAKWSVELSSALKELRSEFAGKEFASSRKQFKARIKQQKLLLADIRRRLIP